MTELFDPLPESPGARRKENTRARVVRASLDAFVEKGIDGATIDDIVTAAGFTRGAFYSNFTSKEEVFAELFVELTDELLAIVRASVLEAPAAPGESDPEAEAAILVDVFESLRPFGRQWALLHSDAVARALRDDRMRELVSAQRARLRDGIALALEQGYGDHGVVFAIPTRDLAQLFLGVFVDLVLREQLEGIDISELAVEAILRILRAFAQERDTAPNPAAESAGAVA